MVISSSVCSELMASSNKVLAQFHLDQPKMIPPKKKPDDDSEEDEDDNTRDTELEWEKMKR